MKQCRLEFQSSLRETGNRVFLEAGACSLPALRVELLIQRGAPVNEPDSEPWATPQVWAAKMKRTAVLAILREHM
jgi:hypothetical protein